MRHSNKLIMISALAFPFMALTPTAQVDAGRLAVEDRLFGFIHEQVSARLYVLERTGGNLALHSARSPAATDLVPNEHDIVAAHANLSPEGRRLATRITTAMFVEGRLFGFDPITVFTIVDQESHMNMKALGGVGERGLIQIRPSTAQAMAKKMKVKFVADRLFEPEYNLHIGLAYLKTLKKRYRHYDMAYLDAYNLGPAKMIQRSIASPAKSKRYVYSQTLARRRAVLVSEFAEHASKMDEGLTSVRRNSTEKAAM